MTDPGLPRFPEDYGRMARWREMRDLPLAELDARYGGPGSNGDLSYVHVQSVIASVWRIEHRMGRRPSASFFDTAGTEWYPDVRHESTDVMLADFGRLEVAGNAYLD